VACGQALDCHRYADCHKLFGGQTQYEESRCRCVQGFVGNGTKCRTAAEGEKKNRILPRKALCFWLNKSWRKLFIIMLGEVDCRSTGGCDSNADCAFSASSGLYECLCRDGFEGDGWRCSRERGKHEAEARKKPFLNTKILKFDVGIVQRLAAAGASVRPTPNAWWTLARACPSAPVDRDLPATAERAEKNNSEENNLSRTEKDNKRKKKKKKTASRRCRSLNVRAKHNRVEWHPSKRFFGQDDKKKKKSPFWPLDLCSTEEEEDCAENASCLEDSAGVRRCFCNRFYEGDGFAQCLPGPGEF
jgi:hypothetical protein